MTIWKFSVTVIDNFQIQMPEGAKILTVDMQGDVPYIWAIVVPNSPLQIRKFVLRGTGHPFVGGEDNYIGSFQLIEGLLVFHLFESI